MLTHLVLEMRLFIAQAVELYLLDIGKVKLSIVDTPYLASTCPETPEEFEKGVLGHRASSHLMKLLYAARMACPWLITQIVRLAKFVSCWLVYHDKALHRLFCFCFANPDIVLNGSMRSSDSEILELHLHSDADQAGDKSTTKSTSGMWLELFAPKTEVLVEDMTWPVEWCSKKQSATASSTAEAETRSLSYGLRRAALSTLDLVEIYLGRKVKLVVHEDNQACIKLVNKGYSPALRHLERTARCSIGFLHELFVENKETAETCVLQYCPTLEQKGDLFTKALERVAFQRNLILIKVTGLRGDSLVSHL